MGGETQFRKLNGEKDTPEKRGGDQPARKNGHAGRGKRPPKMMISQC